MLGMRRAEYQQQAEFEHAEGGSDKKSVMQLLSTNLELVNKKKTQNESKINKYKENISRLQEYLHGGCVSEEEKAYLTDQIQILMAKKRKAESKFHEIHRIEDKLDQFKENFSTSEQVQRGERLLKKYAETLSGLECRISEREDRLRRTEEDISQAKQACRKYQEKMAAEEVRYRSLRIQVEQLQRLRNQEEDRNKSLEKQSIALGQDIRDKQTRIGCLQESISDLQQKYAITMKESDTALEKIKAIQERCQQIRRQYEQALQSVAVLKQHESQTAKQLKQLKKQVAEYSQLKQKKQKLQEEMEEVLKALGQFKQQVEYYQQQKQSMLREFSHIEQEKTFIFEAVLEKERHLKQIQFQKQTLEDRVVKLEVEATKYQKNHAETLARVKELNQNISQLSVKEKSLTNTVNCRLEEQDSLVNRIHQLQMLQKQLSVQIVAKHPQSINTVPALRRQLTAILKAIQRSSHMQRQIEILKEQNKRLRLK